MAIPDKIKRLAEGRGWLKCVTVGAIMEPNVITIPEEATLKELDALITKYQHQGYPVVNQANKVTGVISYKDLLRVAREDWDTIRVKERMSTRLICASPEECVIDAIEKMTKAGVGRLLVMEGDQLVGIISRSCILDKVIKRLLA
ncbi:MAG: CBS domain-containing protein [Methanophagales archaeon ANME-1-THS]|nr:MAG: CBS domain-containing protein [Methanophagales archaeon ANME-1-THS]